jgi:prevent-host-death family protein
MKASVRDLKARLSQYLERASAGEDVVITSRGRPVARLLAISETANGELPPAELKRRLRLIPGLVAGAGGKPRGSARPIAIGKGQKTLAELVLEDRR